jgi:hypothetical protein
VAALIAALAVTAPVAAGPGSDVDPGLQRRLDRIADTAHPDRGTARTSPDVPVELLVDGDDTAVRREVRAAGGRITGSLPDAVVQAVVPADVVDALAALPEVTEARLPRRVNRPEPEPEPDAIVDPPGERTESFGAVTGQAPLATRAEAWFGAGYRGGGVKVGVIDFFDLRRWNESEHGPLPIPGVTMFCRDTDQFVTSYCSGPNTINSAQGEAHGVAVVEIVKDMAPDAQVFIATVSTVSDVVAAIDWMAASGVRIITRSLGAAYDGPGDGTGELADVVDYAASRGMVMFNSAGNDAAGKYTWVDVPSSLGPNALVTFRNGSTELPVTGLTSGCAWLDGVRWSTQSWSSPGGLWGGVRANFQLEVSSAQGGPVLDLFAAPLPYTGTGSSGRNLAAADAFPCSDRATTLRLRIRKLTAATSGPAQRLEVGLTFGTFADGRDWRADGSAAKPVVDSRNPLLLAVGAVDPPFGVQIAGYSSRGPTNDGRVKPDIAAPAGVYSSIYSPSCFSGTSAASPAAAGMAAVLLGAQPGLSPAALAAQMRGNVLDLGAPGTDNAFGAGLIRLPPPPGIGSPAAVAGAVASSRAVRLRAGC